MKLLLAFFRMTRLFNLFYIALTQVLFQYCILIPLLNKDNASFALSQTNFWMIVLSSVLIAAGGYIINDYFDLNIDRVNKPDKMVVDSIIKRRWALFFHMVFSMSGVLISFYLGWKHGAMSIAVANSACMILLWLYSTAFKKKLLSGNIVISILTAWVIMVLYAATIDVNTFQIAEVDKITFQKITRIAIYSPSPPASQE